MYIIDDIVYAGEPNQMLKVCSAKVLEDYKMSLTFSDGTKNIFDFEPLLDKGVFSALKDKGVFERFVIECGVLTWLDGEIDIAPETLHE